MVNLAADSWTKYCNFNFKSKKTHVPKKLFLFFAKISPAIFLRKFIRKPQFCSERCSSRAQSIVLFSFAAKSTLRIKIQCWFFLWRYMNASPFEISKKLLKFILVFDLKAFICKKPNDLLKQHMSNKSSDKKRFTSLSICYIQEKNPFSFFS